MKIFIDSSILEEIMEAYGWGIIDGITTNPSLIKKAIDNEKKKGKKVNMEKYIEEILKVAGETPVSLEVIGTSYEEIVKEGKFLYKRFNKINKNVIVKVPVNPSVDLGSGDKDMNGLKAIKTLSEGGIPINCTLVFSPEQALLAAKAGARFVSPFAGRIDDMLREGERKKFDKIDYFPMDGLKKGKGVVDYQGIISGVDLVEQIVEIFERYNLKTEVLAASIRNSRQFRECALVGADVATVPFSALKELSKHKKTVEGMKGFIKDIVPEYKVLFEG
jgi:transaldolase